MDFTNNFIEILKTDSDYTVWCILYAAICVIFQWKIFTKASVAGWWALIPFANVYKAVKAL